jgi:hypothetical protein
MIIGLHGGTYPTDFVSEDDTDGLVIPKDLEFNAGIGVVITVQDIIDPLDSGRLKQTRIETMEEKKQSGFCPAWGVPVGVPVAIQFTFEQTKYDLPAEAGFDRGMPQRLPGRPARAAAKSEILSPRSVG